MSHPSPWYPCPLLFALPAIKAPGRRLERSQRQCKQEVTLRHFFSSALSALQSKVSTLWTCPAAASRVFDHLHDYLSLVALWKEPHFHQDALPGPAMTGCPHWLCLEPHSRSAPNWADVTHKTIELELCFKLGRESITKQAVEAQMLKLKGFSHDVTLRYSTSATNPSAPLGSSTASLCSYVAGSSTLSQTCLLGPKAAKASFVTGTSTVRKMQLCNINHLELPSCPSHLST